MPWDEWEPLHTAFVLIWFKSNSFLSTTFDERVFIIVFNKPLDALVIYRLAQPPCPASLSAADNRLCFPHHCKMLQAPEYQEEPRMF